MLPFLKFYVPDKLLLMSLSKLKLPLILNEEESKHVAEYEVLQRIACSFKDKLLLYVIPFSLLFTSCQIYDKIPKQREVFL